MSDLEILPSSPTLDDAIIDPSRWANEHWIHSQFTWLRKNDPIRRMSPQGFDPFWSITRYNDIIEIEGNKLVFINDPRPILAPRMLLETLQYLSGRKHLVRSLITMDSPDHIKYRTITQGWFMRGNLRRVEARVKELATTYVNRLGELGGECDFVQDIAIWYPLRVIMSILGIPEEDEPLMMKLTQEIFGSSDPDNRRSFEWQSLMDVVADFDNYFIELTQKRRANPTDDVASLIANAKLDGEPLPQHQTNGYYIIISTAGHDTTSSSTAGGLLALIDNPDEMQKLRHDPAGLMPTAINEMIRWVTPVRQFMRTAKTDCTVSGTEIKGGESCVLWYPSANRDEAIFNEPFKFRVARNQPKHLAFGHGAHVCLGQHLARMEMSAFFHEFLDRVQHVELNGKPQYTQSVFVGGLKSLPIRYQMK